MDSEMAVEECKKPVNFWLHFSWHSGREAIPSVVLGRRELTGIWCLKWKRFVVDFMGSVKGLQQCLDRLLRRIEAPVNFRQSVF